MYYGRGSNPYEPFGSQIESLFAFSSLHTVTSLFVGREGFEPPNSDSLLLLTTQPSTNLFVDCVGLEPTDPEGRWFTATRLCRFANNPYL